MTQLTYTVKITGDVLDGFEQQQAINGFAERFKISQEKAHAMFDKAPVTIKKGLEETKANQFIRVIEGLGLGAILEASEQDNLANTIVEKPASTLNDLADSSTEKPLVQQEVVLSSVGDVNQVPSELPGFQFKYAGKPDFGFITVDIPANETIKVEASAMATMDSNISMKTKMRGGLGRLVSGESLFLNEFTAENGSGEIGIAPGTPGDITHEYLNGNTIFLQNSAFVACTMGVEVETKWQGLTKGFFSGESFFLIRCSGQGDIWFNTYGALVEIDIDGEYVVDSGNIVAFSEGLQYEITSVGGYKSLFFSGEGFVCRFSGHGKLWMQTRGTDAFVSWCQPFRRVEKK